MDVDGFDWTILGLGPADGRLVWGLECSSCGWVKPLPGAELLDPEEQEAVVVLATSAHECAD